MSVAIATVKDYLKTLNWIDNGLLSTDMVAVLDFLDSVPDSRWIVVENKRCIVLVNYWQERLRYCIRQLDLDLSQLRDQLDQTVQRELVESRRQIKSRYVEAGVQRNPEYRTKLDCRSAYELALGTLDGIAAALETSLIVQEAVTARRQEAVDNIL